MPLAPPRYDNWDAQLTQRTSADSPRWVAFRAQESPDDLRPESNGARERWVDKITGTGTTRC